MNRLQCAHPTIFYLKPNRQVPPGTAGREDLRGVLIDAPIPWPATGSSCMRQMVAFPVFLSLTNGKKKISCLKPETGPALPPAHKGRSAISQFF